jgi:hypothetical protein
VLPLPADIVEHAYRYSRYAFIKASVSDSILIKKEKGKKKID